MRSLHNLFYTTGQLKCFVLLGSDVMESRWISQTCPVDPSESEYKSCEILLYTHSPESSRITVNCSCDTEQGYEDTMMGSHPGGRVTACSIRCSILEYLMEMMVIFISPLGSFLSGQTNYRIFLFRVEKPKMIFDRSVGILRTSDRSSRNIDSVISGHLRSGVSHH
ncbi:hypothetical protein IGI04_014987 [Brassica rapa subsp. trilocularis]|uniref:Uncharacterized protein n=1 Tax=Brassica rapa subsp. trilocularis TaxID=1813537 RepID=A0ABQ7MNU1_BRACM|nr:hypothetical protein IGI04_014987 [Brassica rapa subsp. trilocularis]